MKLNVGSGNTNFEGYVNCDVRKLPNVKIVCPAWDIPLENGSIKAIYSRHMIEHLTFAEVKRVFKEWRRILQPGGVAEVSCPDIDYCFRIMQDPDSRNDINAHMTNRQVAMGGLWGWQAHEYDVHRSGWDVRTLSRELEDAGFTEVWTPFRHEVLQPKLYRPHADVNLKARK